MKSLLVLLILVIPHIFYGQLVQLRGKLLDDSTSTPVAYGTLRLENQAYGAVSNAEGEFELSVPASLLNSRNHLRVSSIGYHNYRIPLSQLGTGEYLLIRLRQRPYTLEDVMIYSTDLTAAQLVAEAFKRIAQNYPDRPYLLRTFYRHYCREGDTYGRLIEAAVDILDAKGHKRLRKKPADKLQLKVRQLRRSFDFTDAGTGNRHLPIALYSSLQHDLVSYKSRLLRLTTDSRYTFAYTDTTYFDDQLVYVVECKGRNYECELYISAADLAFVKVDERRYTYLNTQGLKYWRKEHYSLNYKKYGNRYYLSHLTNEGENQSIRRDSLGREVDRSGHAHHVEIMTNEIVPGGFQKFKGREPGREELLRVPYDARFWEAYNVLKATPLEAAIEADLARRMPLEQQFSNFNRQASDPYYHDRLMAQLFDHLLEQQVGKVTLVYFWDSSKLPSVREVLLARKVAKHYSQAPIEVILVSMEASEAEWQKTLGKNGLAGASNLRLALGGRSPLAQRYGIQGPPHYLIFDKQGKLAMNVAKLPSRKEVEAALDRLLDM
ncbi:MAG: hypothetical protein D6730_20150 [Bacteroidetes bacterium]|nr:MAG: hypothetical protein D6730_20150 [Bacteroidota bacterium]